jgi:hypothetical protein
LEYPWSDDGAYKEIASGNKDQEIHDQRLMCKNLLDAMESDPAKNNKKIDSDFYNCT